MATSLDPLLADLIARARAAYDAGRVPVAVYDLDGTLFDNGPRTWRILVEHAAREGLHGLHRGLMKLPSTGLPYLVDDIVALAGGAPATATATLRDAWRRRFFSHEAQMHDVPMIGAVRHVRALHDEKVHIVYLTGRDVPGMARGCLAALESNGFPVASGRTTLILKPTFTMDDLAFKAQALDDVDALGAVIAAFDNEPANCNLFIERWPSSHVGWFDAAHAPGAPALHDGVRRLTAFVDDR